MHGVDDTIELSYHEPVDISHKVTVYLASETLREARMHATRAEWADFKEAASAALGRKISANEFAAVLNHGPHTIKRVLGLTGQIVPKCQKVIADIESFMFKHYKDNFRMFEAYLSLAAKSKARKRKKPESPEGSSESPKRTRTNISTVGGEFIDKFLPTYVSFSGNYKARNLLYKEILEQAKTREETLHSADWSVPTIQKRLQNAYTRQNRLEQEAAE